MSSNLLEPPGTLPDIPGCILGHPSESNKCHYFGKQVDLPHHKPPQAHPYGSFLKLLWRICENLWMLDPKVHEIILQLHVQEQKCMIIKDCVFQYRRNPYKSSNLESINMKSMKTKYSGPQNPKEAIDLDPRKPETNANPAIWNPQSWNPWKSTDLGPKIQENSYIWLPEYVKSMQVWCSGSQNSWNPWECIRKRNLSLTHSAQSSPPPL